MTLAALLLDGPEPPGGVSLVHGGRTWTRAGVRESVAGYVRWLEDAGVERGRRVLALVDHDPRGIFLLAAASVLGVRLVMPYNLAPAPAAEWRDIVPAAAPDAVVSTRTDTAAPDALAGCGVPVVALPPGAAPPARPAEIARLGDLGRAGPTPGFLVLFTSGTTGTPKAISVSEELMVRRVRSVSARLGFARGSRVLLSGLLNNTTGVIFSFGAAAHGATIVVPPDRDVTTWPRLVAAERITHMMTRPVALRRFVAALDAEPAADVSSLRTVAYGAAAMPRELLDRARALVPCAWTQGYGLSETYGPFCWLDEEGHAEGRHRRGTYCVGRPDDTVEVDIVPVEGCPPGVGEVVLRGPGRMEGYLDVRAGTVEAPGEWMRTGDLATWSPDGDLLLKGRLSASLLTADGHRVFPEEVEAALARVAGVDDAVLVGLDLGRAAAGTPVACLSGPLAADGPGRVRRRVVERLDGVLSREKWPDLLFVTTEPFPVGANDKILRAQVGRQVDRAALIEL